LRRGAAGARFAPAASNYLFSYGPFSDNIPREIMSLIQTKPLMGGV